MQRPTPALMIQATGSNAGKSTIVAGLARVLVRRGLEVAPFKPQNMSNNAAAAVEGGEIGRAQALEARAAPGTPSRRINPGMLEPGDDQRNRIKGFVINKFRGEPELFRSGEATITQMTGWPSLGLVPWLPAAAWLPAEDALDLQGDVGSVPDALVIAVPMLSRVANFDDFDPLRMEPNVKLIWVRPGEPIPASADVVLLPGTKSTVGDLAFLRAQGWDIDIKAHVPRGGHVLGICGGYQLLGRGVVDPD